MDASVLIENRISELADWRGQKIGQLRKLVMQAAPNLVEEWKWDTPVWSSNGNVLAIGAFQDHIKINFFKGAMLDDPKHLFNAGLEAKATRAIDIFEKDSINEAALQDLVRSAVELNNFKPGSSPKPSTKPSKKKAPAAPKKRAATKSTKAKKKK